MKKGFTFIELLIVLVVLMTLLAWALPQYLSTVQKEHQTQKSALEQARQLQHVLNTRGQRQQVQLDNLERTLQNIPRKTGTARKAAK